MIAAAHSPCFSFPFLLSLYPSSFPLSSYLFSPLPCLPLISPPLPPFIFIPQDISSLSSHFQLLYNMAMGIAIEKHATCCKHHTSTWLCKLHWLYMTNIGSYWPRCSLLFRPFSSYAYRYPHQYVNNGIREKHSFSTKYLNYRGIVGQREPIFIRNDIPGHSGLFRESYMLLVTD